MAGNKISSLEKVEEMAEVTREISVEANEIAKAKEEFVKSFYGAIKKAIKEVLTKEDIRRLAEAGFCIDIEFEKTMFERELEERYGRDMDYLAYIRSYESKSRTFGFRLIVSFESEDINVVLKMITGTTQIDLQWITTYRNLEDFTIEEFEEFAIFSDLIFENLLRLLKEELKRRRGVRRKVVEKVSDILAKLS